MQLYVMIYSLKKQIVHAYDWVTTGLYSACIGFNQHSKTNLFMI
uniref:Uncharacterized protein n=1 Tax=Arundo donax TaxID=35708 RepID=A0A0A9B986_ARUDO